MFESKESAIKALQDGLIDLSDPTLLHMFNLAVVLGEVRDVGDFYDYKAGWLMNQSERFDIWRLLNLDVLVREF